MVRNKFSVEKIEKYYDAQILPNFIKDLPKSVDEYHRAVPMEIAIIAVLSALGLATLSIGINIVSIPLFGDKTPIAIWTYNSSSGSI